MGALAFGTAEGYAAMASAAGGMVVGEDQLALVHKNAAGDRVITDGGSIVGTDGDLRIIKKMRFGKSCEALRDALLGLSPNA